MHVITEVAKMYGLKWHLCFFALKRNTKRPRRIKQSYSKAVDPTNNTNGDYNYKALKHSVLICFLSCPDIVLKLLLGLFTQDFCCFFFSCYLTVHLHISYTVN